jgi:carbonic anhydrase
VDNLREAGVRPTSADADPRQAEPETLDLRRELEWGRFLIEPEFEETPRPDQAVLFSTRETEVMCDSCKSEVCKSEVASRRDLLKFGSASMFALGLGMLPRRARAAEGAATTLSPEEALAALKSGNARYTSDPQVCSIDLAKQRRAVAAHQEPWATIIGCADSRVPPELIFGGYGAGELFVARNAGNLVDTATLGTVEYGAAVLGSPLIVVLAHTSCGAVKAACDVVSKNATYPGAIGPMIDPILPAAIAVRDTPGDFVDNAAKESAKRTAGRLTAASTLLAGLVGAGKLKIVPAIYDLQSGVVRYLD